MALIPETKYGMDGQWPFSSQERPKQTENAKLSYYRIN